MNKKSTLALCILFLLLFWGTRIIDVQRFPPFIDEVQHVHEAEQAFLGHPFAYVGEGRLFSIWWLTPFQPYHAATVLVMRTAVLLVVLIGFAAILGIGRLAGGYWGATVCGLLYLFSLYHAFFERLALADPLAGAAVSLALYFAYRLSKRMSYQDAILTGIALSLAVGSKATTLPYVGIPIAAALTLWPDKRTLRQNIRWGAVAVATELIFIGAYFIGLTLFRQNPFGFIGLYNSWSNLPLLTRTLNNLLSTVDLLSAYVGIGFVILLAGFVLIRWPHKWFFIVCLFAPAAALWINERYYSRYYGTVMLLFLVCGGLALAKLSEKRKPLMVVLIVLIFGSRWLTFTVTADTHPENLPLWSRDYEEYVRSDASGFEIREARDVLKEQGATQVIGALPNCDSLYYLSLGQFTVVCPKMNPNGSSIASISALINDNLHAGSYLVLEDSPYLPSSAPGQLIGTYSRPQQGSTFRLYNLLP